MTHTVVPGSTGPGPVAPFGGLLHRQVTARGPESPTPYRHQAEARCTV